MLIDFKRSQGSICLRIKILNSSVATGAGLTGLTFESAGLIISTIADNEATPTVYTQAAGHIETIATLGTYAAPTADKCRFKEIDATNHPGLYEIQLADARYAVSDAKSMTISVSGAANVAETDVTIPLRDVDPYDAVRGGMTALPNAAADAAGGMPISDAGGLDLDAKLAHTEEITAARAGYWDNLNVGGNVASQADVQGITQACRVRVCTPPQMERPDSDTTSYRIWIYAYDEQHKAEDLDENPTVTAENNEGTDRSSNLGSVTKSATGAYYVDYTVSYDDEIEGLVFFVSATEGGVTAVYPGASVVVDTLDEDMATTIADAVLSRSVSYVEAAVKSGGNFDCLASLILQGRRWALDPVTGEVIIYETDGETEFTRLTPSSDANANPLVSVAPSS